MQPQEITSKLTALPLFKGFDTNQLIIPNNNQEIATTTPTNKKAIAKTVLTLGGIGVALWGLFTFILPQLFAGLGIVALYGGIAIGITFLVIMFPFLIRYFKNAAIKAERRLVAKDPFIVLDKKRQEIKTSKQKFILEKTKIEGVQKNCEFSAYDYEQKAKETSDKIVRLNKNLQSTITYINNNIQRSGEAYKEQDEYQEFDKKKRKLLGEAQRKTSELEQYNRFVQVYGVRGKALKKISKRLDTIEVVLDEKEKDFESSLKMLKEEFKFSNDVKNASTAAKSAMGLSNKWDVEFALDVATSTIENNINQTVANLDEISKIADLLTTNFDDEDAIERLNETVSKIENGDMFSPKASSYKNPDYQMTMSDQRNAGQMGRLAN